jgi:hypothetical protein
MLGFIPLIGPILQGLSGIVSSFTSLAGVKLTTASQTTIAETQASAAIIASTNDDLGLRIMRDAACLPVVAWTALIGWDTIVANTSWNVYMWHVAPYPPSVEYIPYAVLVFLFGNIGLNMWKR